MRAWLRRMAALRLRRDDFPWPHWEIANDQGTEILLWPWRAPHRDEEDGQ